MNPIIAQLSRKQLPNPKAEQGSHAEQEGSQSWGHRDWSSGRVQHSAFAELSTGQEELWRWQAPGVWNGVSLSLWPNTKLRMCRTSSHGAWKGTVTKERTTQGSWETFRSQPTKVKNSHRIPGVSYRDPKNGLSYEKGKWRSSTQKVLLDSTVLEPH